MVKTLTLMTAPIDFSVGGDQSLVQFWSNPDYFDVDSLIDAFGNVPAGLPAAQLPDDEAGAELLQQVRDLLREDGRRRSSSRTSSPWRSGRNDNIPVAGETFREFVKKLYQQQRAGQGRVPAGPGRRARCKLSRITCPLMLLTASADHLVPPSQTEGIVPHVGSKDVKSMTLDAGHIGLAVSTKAHKTFWPDATKWIADRSTATKA